MLVAQRLSWNNNRKRWSQLGPGFPFGAPSSVRTPPCSPLVHLQSQLQAWPHVNPQDRFHECCPPEMCMHSPLPSILISEGPSSPTSRCSPHLNRVGPRIFRINLLRHFSLLLRMVMRRPMPFLTAKVPARSILMSFYNLYTPFVTPFVQVITDKSFIPLVHSSPPPPWSQPWHLITVVWICTLPSCILLSFRCRVLPGYWAYATHSVSCGVQSHRHHTQWNARKIFWCYWPLSRYHFCCHHIHSEVVVLHWIGYVVLESIPWF